MIFNLKTQWMSGRDPSTGPALMISHLSLMRARRFLGFSWFAFAFCLVAALGASRISVGSMTGVSFARSQKEIMTNEAVIELVKAGVSDDVIIQLIRKSEAKFDTSPGAIAQLKKAGVSNQVLAVILEVTTSPSGSTSTGPSTNELVAKPNVRPPDSYGLYIEQNGQLQPLGRVQTKVQISKWRSFLGGMVPFVRRKIDINIPGAHSARRFSAKRPTFYAYFPQSRDVTRFKLLQCKITGQRFDQRTVANASILFSTEQNQDEIPCDIGPTEVRDLYRIVPKEDLVPSEYAFVEGEGKLAANIGIIDVYDFGIDREEPELALDQYLDTLPSVSVTDMAFHSWTKEECQKIVTAREGKVGLMGDMLGWFKRQYASLDIYWVDDQFARAFARLEMLERNLTPEQANKLYNLVRGADQRQYIILVAIGQKVGSGRLIGANEGERLMRPYDVTLSTPKGVIVAARRVEPLGGYAGLWKVSFDRESTKGPILSGAEEVIFEARLNQNLDLKASFKMDKLAPMLARHIGPDHGRDVDGASALALKIRSRSNLKKSHRASTRSFLADRLNRASTASFMPGQPFRGGAQAAASSSTLGSTRKTERRKVQMKVFT